MIGYETRHTRLLFLRITRRYRVGPRALCSFLADLGVSGDVEGSRRHLTHFFLGASRLDRSGSTYPRLILPFFEAKKNYARGT